MKIILRKSELRTVIRALFEGARDQTALAEAYGYHGPIAAECQRHIKKINKVRNKLVKHLASVSP